MVDAMNTFDRPFGNDSQVLDQTLHGYNDGHRLLASSVAVPDEVGRLMLRQSDLSGTIAKSGFEEYFTGYPLKSIGAYALAKSWYASDMPRPGCVWTHTILIRESLLARIPDLGLLRLLFVRPKKEVGFSSFKEVLSFNADSFVHLNPAQPKELKRFIEAIIYAHYSEHQAPIVLPARDSSEFENVIFGLWSQKWPSLRMDFTFSTGALSARSVAGSPFDIQCVPIAMTRDVCLEISSLGPAKPKVIENSPIEVPSWAEVAAADLSSMVAPNLKTFLSTVCDEASTRTDFALFATIYGAISKSTNLSEMFSLVSKTYPSRDRGIRLKNVLLGNQLGDSGQKPFDEQELLILVGTNSEYESFALEELQFEARATSFCSSRPDAAVTLISSLLSGSLNPFGEKILVGAISGIALAGALRLAREKPQFIPALVKVRPGLMAERELWAVAGEWRRELFDCAWAQESIDENIISTIIDVILRYGPESLFKRALDRWRRPAVFGVLNSANERDAAISTICKGALTFHVQEVMDWVESPKEKRLSAILIAAHVVAPYSHQISKRTTDAWMRAYQELKRDPHKDEELFLATFLLALAFGNAPPSPLALIAECFEKVHDALWENRLPYDTWIILDPIVPHLWWPYDWDKCERLRRGLIEAFVRHGWPSDALEHCIRNSDLLQRICRSGRMVSGWN